MMPPSFFASFLCLTIFGLVLLGGATAHPFEGAQIIQISGASTNVISITSEPSSTGCFPELGFEMPSSTPSSTDSWWCSTNSEYGFVGFSYEVTSCQSAEKLKEEFLDIRQTFNGRYVRLYGACDRVGFYDDVIDAAWEAGVGVYALIWFGFDNDDKWMTRRDTLLGTLHSNPKAQFVTRAVQFGSEPLFDSVLSPIDLAAQITSAKANLSSLSIPVIISELAYGYQAHLKDGSMEVLDVIDFIGAHMLPFFSANASQAKHAWPLVQTDIDWFVKNGSSKKIYLTQNGWPSTSYPGVKPNSRLAVSNVQNEQDYYTLLDENCEYFKSVPGGGVGWFAHIYSDYQEPGYGIYGNDGVLKFPFSPKTSC